MYTWNDIDEMTVDELKMEVLRLRQALMCLDASINQTKDQLSYVIEVDEDWDVKPPESLVRLMILECDQSYGKAGVCSDVELKYGIDFDCAAKVYDNMVQEGLL